jgi:chorismate synthase
MPGNSFGTLFRVTTFGESHGPAIGGVVDGAPPRLPLSETDLQVYLDRRRPGQNRHTTQRREPDTVRILSGVFDGVTTGAPIGLLIENQDARSKDYSAIMETYRPGHADFTYDQKYGLRDYRGGGRSSARETAVRVAAGAIARRVLGDDVQIRGALVQMGPHAIDPARWDWAEIERNPFWCPVAETAARWETYLDGIRKAGSSTGGVVQVCVSGIAAGLGEPVFDRLDADLAKAMVSIPAVKGVEIGAGFAAAAREGPENNDTMHMEGGRPVFDSNNAGGVLGGISTGAEIVVCVAIKPTSSISSPQPTITKGGEETEIVTKGRHDPCVAIRGVPVAEAMAAITLADHLLRHKAQCG